jgi:hypothetical protein
MGDHARLAPSSAHRWFECPGSIREIEKVASKGEVSSEQSPAARDGSISHLLLETCLHNNTCPLDYVGRSILFGGESVPIDKERAERVKVAYDHAMELRSDGYEIFAEEVVYPGDSIGREDCWGTADIIAIKDKTLRVIDLKDGYVKVGANRNKQLMLYLLGAVETHELEGIENFVGTIVQPKLKEQGLPQITDSVYSSAEIDEFKDQFEKTAEATDDPEAPLIPGDHCKYCPTFPCRAVTEDALDAIGVDWGELVMTSANMDVESLTDERLCEMIEAAPMIRSLLESAEEIALTKIKSGQSIEGLKVIRGRGSKVWNFDNDDEVVGKLQKMGMPKSVSIKTKVVTPNQAIKATWKTKSGTEKSLSKRQVKSLTDNYVKKVDGKLKVVPEHHEGEAVTFDISHLFSPVVDETPTEELPDFLSSEIPDFLRMET